MFIETYFENWVSFLKCLTIQIPFHIINIISSQPHTAASYHHSDIFLPSISSKGVSSLLGTLEGSTFIRKFSCVHGQLLQWCSTLCNPMVCSLPGSSVHGILLARILEWIAMISSRGSLPAEVKPMSLESPALQVDYLLLSHWWSPDQLILSHLPQSSLLPTQITAYFLVCILWRLLLCFVCDYNFPKVPDKSLVPAILGALTVMVCDSVNCLVVSNSVTP